MFTFPHNTDVRCAVISVVTVFLAADAVAVATGVTGCTAISIITCPGNRAENTDSVLTDSLSAWVAVLAFSAGLAPRRRFTPFRLIADIEKVFTAIVERITGGIAPTPRWGLPPAESITTVRRWVTPFYA